jgi:hypothetical protein
MGVRLVLGVNDLLSLFPSICEECDEWDPSKYHAFSNKKKPWQCANEHRWEAIIANRTKHGKNCPYCTNKYAWPGDNDLKTLFPRIAKEAYGWDPSRCLPFSHANKEWICEAGHVWKCVVSRRTSRKTKCPICTERILITGSNDLATMFPAVAKEADGWDASITRYGSNDKKQWKCEKGHIYLTSPNHRTRPDSPTGCPSCSETGYKKSKLGWIYLMERAGEQQIGITNQLKQRLQCHKRNGWVLVESIGPINGCLAADIEKIVKQYLRRTRSRIRGTHENWPTTKIQASSLRDIFMLAGVDSLLLELLS